MPGERKFRISDLNQYIIVIANHLIYLIPEPWCEVYSL
jgi:hypothetical protein